MCRRILIVLLLGISVLALGQNTRNYMRAADQFIENGYYEEALDQYSKAIEFDPQNGELYQARALMQVYLERHHEAAEDYMRAAVLGENTPENYLRSADFYLRTGEYSLCRQSVSKAIESKGKYYEAYLLQCELFLQTNSYTEARQAAVNAIDAKNTAHALYLKGKSEFLLQNYAQAGQDLEKAIIKDKMLLDAYLILAEIKLINKQYNYAIENCNYVILNDRNNARAYVVRSKAYRDTREFEKSITDASKAISIDSSNTAYFLLRGKVYLEYAQFQNAINDFTVVLNKDMLDLEALQSRASAYEKIGRNAEAVSDYALLLKLAEADEQLDADYFAAKIYSLNRESVKPVLKVLDPLVDSDFDVSVPRDQESITVTTSVEDASLLRLLRVNNDTLFYDPDGVAPGEFSVDLDGTTLEYLTVSATDIYDNTSTVSYTVQRVETYAPKVTLLTPYPAEDGIISVSSDEKYLYLEGRIEDESPIASILIDDVTASFAPRDINPRFTATVDVTRKNKIVVQAVDIHGNLFEKEYLFKRDGQLMISDTPMGKTWVILIENSEYKDFPNLTSPEKDMQLMQQALSRYQVNKVIVKRNLSKREMERFFSIDLRDLVRTNNVNSLLIWFAGHGENVEGNGYWIPSDATMDVEFSYFNVNALKGSLYSYTTLTHLLVVSDACQTGPGFITAMRGPIDGAACSDTQLAYKKSAQVFTSAGSGYAYDNSLFTRAFANALLNNADDCATINDIAKRVSIIMQSSSSQRPEFGRISGLDDDLGTFFFMSR